MTNGAWSCGSPVSGDPRPELPPLRRRTSQGVGLVRDDHVPGVVLDLLQPVPRDHDPLQAAVPQRRDRAAPVTDRDRGGPVGHDQHPSRAAEVAHRRRPEDRGDRLAHAGLVGEQELPSARRGARRDRIGCLELDPPGLELVGRLGAGRRVVGVEGVLDEPTERVGPRRVRREVRGQGAPDVQVGLDGRVPGGAVDLGPVRDVEHPQPLARPGDRQRPLLRRAPLRRGDALRRRALDRRRLATPGRYRGLRHEQGWLAHVRRADDAKKRGVVDVE